MKKGGIFILSGPSGCGKNTVYEWLRALDPDIVQTVSATTRKPRPGERNGVDYYFETVEEFKRRIDNDEFVEYVTYGGNNYGTLKSEVERLTALGKTVVLVIEVRGALNIKRMFPDVMRDIEQDSIRNFKFQPDTGNIVIDEPDEGDYHFHFE